jgi:hypothetical protein
MAMTRAFDTNRNLLRMIEWDHKSRYGWSYDTWCGGKYFRRWADPDVVSDVERCFAKLGTTEMAEVHAILAGHPCDRQSTGAFARPHEADADLNC